MSRFVVLVQFLLLAIYSCVALGLTTPSPTASDPSFPINAPKRLLSPDQNVNEYRWLHRRARKRACTLSNPVRSLIINPGSILTWQGMRHVATGIDKVDLVIAYMIMGTIYLSYMLATNIMDGIMNKARDGKENESEGDKHDKMEKANQHECEHKDAEDVGHIKHKKRQKHGHHSILFGKCHKKDKKLLRKLLKRAKHMSKDHRMALLHAIIAYIKARKMNPTLRLKHCLKDILDRMGIPLHPYKRGEHDDHDNSNECNSGHQIHEDKGIKKGEHESHETHKSHEHQNHKRKRPRCQGMVHLHLHRHRHSVDFDGKPGHLKHADKSHEENHVSTQKIRLFRMGPDGKLTDAQGQMNDDLRQKINAAMSRLQDNKPNAPATGPVALNESPVT